MENPHLKIVISLAAISKDNNHRHLDYEKNLFLNYAKIFHQKAAKAIQIMEWISINNEAEYRKALEELELIFSAKKGSSEGMKLELLSKLIDEYEKKVYPFE